MIIINFKKILDEIIDNYGNDIYMNLNYHMKIKIG